MIRGEGREEEEKEDNVKPEQEFVELEQEDASPLSKSTNAPTMNP